MLISRIFLNSYRDSVLLMKMASAIRNMDGVDNAEVMIATQANKSILEFNGLLTEEIRAATPNDLVVSISSQNDEAAESAINKAEELLYKGLDDSQVQKATYSAKSIAGAIAMNPEANLAIISTPGPFVKKDALMLLDKGLHLLIFSDNVPIEAELELKQKAAEKDLMVMGPDCGTAIIGGAALAFANKVNQGNIGMVCASGTGLQEVSVAISNMGKGISHAIGTGGNDVSDYIGGITMKQGIRWLEKDARTDIIVVISKPPGIATMKALKEEFSRCKKPLIVNFLGRTEVSGWDKNVYYTRTLQETALKAIELAGGPVADFSDISPEMRRLIQEEAAKHGKGTKYLRALYTGGTLGTECCIICKDMLSQLTSNISVPGITRMSNPHTSEYHCVVDMGADEFTLGKPHPMIEPEMKNRRLLKEAEDKETAVVLLDFVLGFGINPDPVGETIAYIRKAQKLADKEGRHITFVASVCGTDADPQNRTTQSAMLIENNVLVLPTNAQAVKVAVQIILECEKKEGK